VADAALTPVLALDYLQELSTDIRSAIVFDGGDRLAAGPAVTEPPEALRALVTDLFERADATAGGSGRAAQVEVALGPDAVFAVRAHGWTVAVVARRHALPSLMFYDLRSVASDLGSAQ
jgi:hypothetical protein